VEDNPTDALLVRETLHDVHAAEFRVTSVECLAEATALLDRDDFDVVLLDLGLSDSVGIDTFLVLRRADPDLPVLVLSGLDDEEVGMKAVSEGAQDYLLKGQLQAPLLGRSIRYAMERHRIGTELDLRIDQLAKSEARFRNVFNQQFQFMSILSREGTVLQINQLPLRITGLEPTAFVSKLFWETPPWRNLPDWKEIWPSRLAQAAATNGPLLTEDVYKDTSGATRYADAATTAIRDSRGEVEYFIIQTTDTTKRRLAEAALRESEYRFRQVVEGLPQLVWTCDSNGRCDFVNRQWTDYTKSGTTDRGLESLRESLRWIDHLHADDVEPSLLAWNEAVASGSDFHAEFRIRRHDGAYRWFDSRAVPLRGLGSDRLQWLGANTDVHRAREMQDALRDEQERLRQIIATAPGAIVTFRVAANGAASFPFASSSVEEIYGSSPAELEKNAARALDKIHPEDAAAVSRSIEASARTLAPWRCEYRVLHPEKGEIWVEGHSMPVREPDGATVWHGFLRDATERRLGDEALRQSEARLLAALEAGNLGTWIYDFSKQRLLWDEPSCRIWGRSAVELADNRTPIPLSFLYPEDRPGTEQTFRAYLGSEIEKLVTEFRVTRGDGEVVWIESRGRIDLDSDGRPRHMTGTYVDISDRKRTEILQLRSQKLEALGTLAGGIAHDFNNILVAITGNAKLASEDLPVDHPCQECLTEIGKAGSRATDLVRRILTFSLPVDQNLQIVSLQEVVEEGMKLVRATQPAMIELKTSLSPDAPRISGEASQIHQIIVNLATNAAHALGSRGGRIHVSVEAVESGGELSLCSPALPPGRYVRLSVSDNGCGMDRRTLERIFDPFFTTKPAGQGTGLGLSVVHGIVKSHGGAISVDSHEGQGTTFHLYFPAADGALAPDAPSVIEARHGQGEHVLYVDDEQPLVFLATRMLKGLGYRVTGCTDAARALAEFRSKPKDFDLVVTDLSMPGMSGFELARELIAMRPDVPILMTSGYIRPEDKQTARKIGIREVVLKPNTVRELGQALDRLFRDHETQS
jgi:PAS domain S-box-containing protein